MAVCARSLEHTELVLVRHPRRWEGVFLSGLVVPSSVPELLANFTSHWCPRRKKKESLSCDVRAVQQVSLGGYE
jgi:hypothetical protein